MLVLNISGCGECRGCVLICGQAELVYMLEGKVSVTALDTDGGKLYWRGREGRCMVFSI